MKKRNLKSLKLNKKYISDLSEKAEGGRGPRYISDPIMCGGDTAFCNTINQQTCNFCSDGCGSNECQSVPAAISCQIC